MAEKKTTTVAPTEPIATAVTAETISLYPIYICVCVLVYIRTMRLFRNECYECMCARLGDCHKISGLF